MAHYINKPHQGPCFCYYVVLHNFYLAKTENNPGWKASLKINKNSLNKDFLGKNARTMDALSE